MTEDTGREEPKPRATDRGLAPERTALAWLRMALSLLVVMLVLARFVAHLNVVLAVAAAGLAIPLSATVGVAAWQRFMRAARGFNAGGQLPDGVLPAALTALAALMGVVGIGYVLLA
jgi:uncharacterized membrane protein YidH (DUF202 family)